VAIGPDYFRTLGATVLAGREFRDSDGVSGVPVVVVNQRFASRHWPGEDPVGKRLRLFLDGQSPGAWLTVVGVASNIVQNDVIRTYETLPLVYVPYGPRPIGMWLFVHSPLPLSGFITAFRREMNALDPILAIQEGPYRLADRIAADKFYTDIRNQAVLYLIFGAIAVTLASIGLYAVIAHSVSQRTQEIGVRLALGATSHDILALVSAQGLRPAGVGLAIGLIAALGLTPILKSQLVHVSPTDPITLLVAMAVLMAAAMLGCWVPARRAMRVDPVVALRHE
jgi:ABC-type antimicrobial peptide transport system permease subunit